MILNAPVAQRIEHQPSKPVVVGSNPTGRANSNTPRKIAGRVLISSRMWTSRCAYPRGARRGTVEVHILDGECAG